MGSGFMPMAYSCLHSAAMFYAWHHVSGFAGIFVHLISRFEVRHLGLFKIPSGPQRTMDTFSNLVGLVGFPDC